MTLPGHNNKGSPANVGVGGGGAGGTSPLILPTISATGIVSHWALADPLFDDGVTPDYFGSNNLTLAAALQFGSVLAPGLVYPYAINGPGGTNVDARRASNASLQTGDIDFSFFGWFRSNDNANNTSSQNYIFGKDAGTGSSLREYSLQWTSGGNVRWQVSSNGGAGGNSEAVSSVAPTQSNWYFFYCWHDSVNDEIGLRVADATDPVYTNYDEITAAHSGGVHTTAQDFMIFGTAASTSAKFRGRCTAFTFYKRLLTGEEQEIVFDSGTGLRWDFTE